MGDHPVCFSGVFWLTGSSPPHRCSSQKRPGKRHAREQVERKHRGERKPEVLGRGTGLAGCMEQEQLGSCGEAPSSRKGRGVMKPAER